MVWFCTWSALFHTSPQFFCLSFFPSNKWTQSGTKIWLVNVFVEWQPCLKKLKLFVRCIIYYLKHARRNPCNVGFLLNWDWVTTVEFENRTFRLAWLRIPFRMTISQSSWWGVSFNISYPQQCFCSGEFLIHRFIYAQECINLDP